jgi:hypothetical protein
LVRGSADGFAGSKSIAFLHGGGPERDAPVHLSDQRRRQVHVAVVDAPHFDAFPLIFPV